MKEQTILFSVIIPTFNRAELLLEAIESVLQQGADDCEIIIIDDGSTDYTNESINSLNNERLKYYYQSNQGQSAARNLGVKKAKGRFIIFMDDDDYWLPDHLNQFRLVIEKEDEKRKIYRTGFMRCTQDGKMIAAPNYDPEKDGHPVRWAAFNMCALVCLCIPREFLEDEKSPIGFPHWQDTHLILRLLAKYPFEQLPGHTYVYRIHPQMGSQQHQQSKTIWERAAINVAAIEDLFENHYDLISPYLTRRDRDFLVAEKCIEYANLELKIGDRKKHWVLFKKSLNKRVDGRLWKHYILFAKHLIRP